MRIGIVAHTGKACSHGLKPRADGSLNERGVEPQLVLSPERR